MTPHNADPGSLAPLLSPPSYRGRAEEVAQRLEEAIQLGLLADGEQLPTEIELATQFGISPMTLREALAALRDRKLVVTRRGRNGGSFVRRPAGPDPEELGPRLAAMTMSQLRDLCDEQAAVHGHTARLAAGRASPTNVRRLFALAEQLSGATTVGDRLRADSRFHIEVAMASQSERLTRREVVLQGELAGLVWLPMGDQLAVEEVVGRHHALAKAIADEDEERAGAIAEEDVALRQRRLVRLHLALADGPAGEPTSTLPAESAEAVESGQPSDETDDLSDTRGRGRR